MKRKLFSGKNKQNAESAKKRKFTAKQKFLVVAASLFGLLFFAGSVLLAYIYFPPYSYEYPFIMPVSIYAINYANNKDTDPYVYAKNPADFVTNYGTTYHDADGEHRVYTIYVKEGSIHPLSYWQRFITGDTSPTQIRYVKYSIDEARLLWLDFQYILDSDEYAAYSFRFTGDLQFDEELGYRVFLFVDGRDAEFIKEELTKKYGDFVIFDSETYTRYFFKGRPNCA